MQTLEEGLSMLEHRLVEKSGEIERLNNQLVETSSQSQVKRSIHDVIYVDAGKGKSITPK